MFYVWVVSHGIVGQAYLILAFKSFRKMSLITRKVYSLYKLSCFVFVCPQRKRITRHCSLKQWILPTGQQRSWYTERTKTEWTGAARRKSVRHKLWKSWKTGPWTKDDRLVVAQSPLLTPTLKTLWFNCPILNSEFGQVQREKLWNLGMLWLFLVPLGRGRLDSFITVAVFDCFLQFNCF